jgi:hypothetical protein
MQCVRFCGLEQQTSCVVVICERSDAWGPVGAAETGRASATANQRRSPPRPLQCVLRCVDGCFARCCVESGEVICRAVAPCRRSGERTRSRSLPGSRERLRESRDPQPRPLSSRRPRRSSSSLRRPLLIFAGGGSRRPRRPRSPSMTPYLQVSSRVVVRP